MNMDAGPSGTQVISTVRNTNDIVNFLVNKCPFNKLTYEDKLFVKQSERPCPDLSLTLIQREKQKNRVFSLNWYTKYDWLAGSTTVNKLFCWPCILFSNSGESVWWKTGYADLKNLSRSLEKHSKSKDHISSTCKFVLLGQQNIASTLDSARKIEKQ